MAKAVADELLDNAIVFLKDNSAFSKSLIAK
jgi:hypothetical protein